MNGTEIYKKSWVTRIIALNVAVFIVQLIFMQMSSGEQGITLSDIMINYLGVRPDLIIHKYYIWQFVTYMFLHGGFIHILFNMYFLFALGIPVEQTWGGRRFLIYYFFTGIGAGITIFIVNTLIGGVNMQIPTVGASGAIYGVLVAFGMLFPEAEIFLLFIPIPIKAKYLVIIYGAMNIFPLVRTGGQGNISYVGHLGGILFGFLFFLIIRKRGITFKSKIIKARLTRGIDRHQEPVPRDPVSNRQHLEAILAKVKQSGPDSITDDEFQFIRYMEIMTQDSHDQCVEEDFSLEDEYCIKCANVEACLLRHIKKFL
jgi:membrane associated rhomboid family serine protease